MGTIGSLLDQLPGGADPARDHQAEFSLTLRDGQSPEAIEAALRDAAAGHAHELYPAFQGELREETNDRFWILRFPEREVLGHEPTAFELARQLRATLDLKSVRPVLVDSLVGQAMADRESELEAFLGGCNTDDPGPQERGWAPRGVGVLQAWAITRGAGVTVASIDTGYSDHDQLDGVITTTKPHRNLVEGGSDARDRFSTEVPLANPGHGTLVASVVASRGTLGPDGTTDGLKEVTGVAPEAEVLPIRAIRSVVDLRQSRIPAAIEHAIAAGADVIVMALGSAFAIEPVEVALRAATRRGLVVVCAAGNCVGPVVFPARLAPQGLTAAVAAVDHAYAPWEKTSKGDAVTASAFGEAVWGARKPNANAPNDVVAPSQGTTLASSMTAGAAALWVAAHGGRAALKSHADAAGVTVQKMFNDALAATAFRPSGWPRGMGAGVLNVAALVRRPLPAAEEALPDVPLATDHVTPLKRYLAPAVGEADALAGLEAAGLPEDLAAETLWKFYQTSARRRAFASGVELGTAEGIAAAGVGLSPALAAELAAKPRLQDLLR